MIGWVGFSNTEILCSLKKNKHVSVYCLVENNLPKDQTQYSRYDQYDICVYQNVRLVYDVVIKYAYAYAN